LRLSSLVFCFLLSLLSSVGILETIRSTCLCCYYCRNSSSSSRSGCPSKAS
jgi:hypothetical protein